MLPVLVPLNPCVGRGEDQAGNNDVDREFAPEFCRKTNVLSVNSLGRSMLDRSLVTRLDENEH